MDKHHQTTAAHKRNGTAKWVPPSVPIDDYFARQMKDPEFAKAYEELAPEFELVSQIIALRLKHKLSQRELAERMGTPQPSIARMESTQAIKNLDFVRRIADALDCTLEVRLVPKKNGSKVAARRSAETPAKRAAATGRRGEAIRQAGSSAAGGTRRKVKASKQ
jgi:transcriptional regulator with XRE-family HTH domain